MLLRAFVILLTGIGSTRVRTSDVFRRLPTWDNLVDRTRHAFEVLKLLRDLTDFLRK